MLATKLVSDWLLDFSFHTNYLQITVSVNLVLVIYSIYLFTHNVDNLIILPQDLSSRPVSSCSNWALRPPQDLFSDVVVLYWCIFFIYSGCIFLEFYLSTLFICFITFIFTHCTSQPLWQPVRKKLVNLSISLACCKLPNERFLRLFLWTTDIMTSRPSSVMCHSAQINPVFTDMLIALDLKQLTIQSGFVGKPNYYTHTQTSSITMHCLKYP